MASNFFSLGSCSGTNNNTTNAAAAPGRSELQNPHSFQLENLNSNPNPNETAYNSWNSGVLLYRNEEIYQKGFEIWQQYVQVHHPYHHPPKLDRPFLLHHVAQSGARSPATRSMMRSSGSGGLLGGGGMNCQDCGNQAKKDCAHMRCRTCCKSRGFDCATHVKSTWVPAAQRRERQNRLAALQQHSQHQQMEMMRGEGSDDRTKKRHREDKELVCAAAAATTTTTSTGLELGQHFPAEVSAPAVFRCVRVHSTDDAAADQQQLAYQTDVNIGGRVFKGILYDQGLDRRYATTANAPTQTAGAADVSSPAGQQPHNLLAAAATTNQEAATCVDPSNNNNSNSGGMYPPQISAFLAGTQFFPPPRS